MSGLRPNDDASAAARCRSFERRRAGCGTCRKINDDHCRAPGKTGRVTPTASEHLPLLRLDAEGLNDLAGRDELVVKEALCADGRDGIADIDIEAEAGSSLAHV